MRFVLAFCLMISCALGLAIFSPSHAQTYDPTQNRCLTPWKELDAHHNEVRSCGLLREWNEVKFSRKKETADLRGLVLRESDLNSVDLSEVNAEGLKAIRTKLSDAVFEGANLRRAIFRDVDLSRVNFEGADLRGAQIDESSILEGASFAEALVDSETKLEGEPLTCENRKELNVGWPKKAFDPCAGHNIKHLMLGSSLLEDHPNAIVVQEGPTAKVFPSVAIKFEPVTSELVEPGEMGFDIWDEFDLLCAVRWDRCQGREARFGSEYYLKSFPDPVLATGVEFYHAHPDRLEKKGFARFFAVSELILEPQNSDALKQSVQERVGKDVNVVEASWVDYIEKLSVLFHFLEQPQISKCSILSTKTDAKRIKCNVLMDVRVPEVEIEQWIKQLTQAWIRRAQTSTATLSFQLKAPYRKAVFGEKLEEETELSFSVPIKNINFWHLEWGDHIGRDRDKRRWRFGHWRRR